MNLNDRPSSSEPAEIDELARIRTLASAGYGKVTSVRFPHSDWKRVVPVAKDREFRNIFIQMSTEEIEGAKSHKAWVNSNVKPILKRLPPNKKVFLCMGSGEFHNSAGCAENMHRLLDAVSKAAVKNVKVVVPVDASVVTAENRDFLKQLVAFTVRARSFVCLNIYPLEHSQGAGVQMSRLCEVHDTALAYIRTLGVRGCKTVRTIITETGWPYAGGAQASPRATVEYCKYVSTVRKTGTPLAAGPMDIILKSLYDYDGSEGGRYGVVNAINMIEG